MTDWIRDVWSLTGVEFWFTGWVLIGKEDGLKIIVSVDT